MDLVTKVLDSHVQSPHFRFVCAGGGVLRNTLKRTTDIMVTIPEYYAGKNVLITGATGFMGKVRYYLNRQPTGHN